MKSKFDPSAPKIKGTLDKTTTRKAADHKAEYRSAKHIPEQETRKAIFKEKLSRQADINKAVKAIKLIMKNQKMKEISDAEMVKTTEEIFDVISDYDLFRNYSQNPFGFSDHKKSTSEEAALYSDIESRKLKYGLLILTLLIVANAAGADPRVGTEKISEIISQLLKAISESAIKAKTTVNNIIDSSVEYCTNTATNIFNDPVGSGSKIATSFLASTLASAGLRGKSSVGMPAIIGAVVGLSDTIMAKKGDQKNKNNPEIQKLVDGLVNDILYWQHENVRQKLLDIKKGKDKTKLVLTTYDNTHKLPLLFVAANIGAHESVEVILKAVENRPKLLRKILTQKIPHHLDGSPILTAIPGKHVEVVKVLIEAVKNNPALLEEVLMQQTVEKDSPLELAIYNGQTQMVKMIIEAVNGNQELLRKLLLQTNHWGVSVYSKAAAEGITEIFKMITEAVTDPKLLKELLVQVNKVTGRSPLHDAAVTNQNKAVTLILKKFKNDRTFFQELIKFKPKESSKSISIINLLVLAGNWPAVKIILKHYPEINTETIPAGFDYSMAIYYLEAFLDGSGNSASYFKLKKNNLVKIPIEKISLSDNEPTVIEIPQQNGNTRKIILGSHIDTLWREKDRSVLSIKSAIELAKNPKVKEIFKGEIEEIFMNVRVYDEDRLPHKLSLKFSQNEKDREIWNVVIHDPNGQNPIYDKKMEKYIGLVKELAGESNIKVKIIKPEYRKKDGNNIIKDKLRDKGSFIIPNYADSVRTMGHCGVIANLALPSMMIGELHSQELRAKCSEIGENCVKTLEEELNPKISKTLENRLDFAKKTFLSAENLQEDESKSPPPHVKNPKQKKLKPDSNQKQKNEL